MSLKTEKANDQANELRNLFEELEKGNVGENHTDNAHEMENTREVNVLNLPPRKEVHSHPTRMHFAIKRPLLRFLFVLLLLIIILIAAYYFWDNNLLNTVQMMLLK